MLVDLRILPEEHIDLAVTPPPRLDVPESLIHVQLSPVGDNFGDSEHEKVVVGSELIEAAGFDPEDPRVVDALHDTRVAERLVDVLVEMRRKAGLTQADVAREMQTTQSAVSKFERAGGDPHLSTIQRYARAVGAHLHVRVAVAPETPASRRAGHVATKSADEAGIGPGQGHTVRHRRAS